ncbi:MAG: phosphoglycerate kinase [Bdellovibrionales bacterium]
MPSFQTLDQSSFQGQTVLLRGDLNVPIKDGHVTDDERLARLLPTIRELSAAGAKVVIISHFGRPDGKPNTRYSLRPVAEELLRLLGKPVAFAEDCIGLRAEAGVKALNSGEVLILENTRFYPEEEANDPEFAKKLAALGDSFVSDAFSAAHRAHASTEGIAHYLPAYAGRLMQAELEALGKALGNPEHPVAAVVGGAKISGKLDVLLNLIAKVDFLALGGGMANTFVAAKGARVGRSLCEPDMFDTAREILRVAESKGCRIVLPKDVVVAAALQEGVATQIVPVTAVPDDQMIFDLGPESIKELKTCLSSCKTVVWNGPLGVFETPPFDSATNEIAAYVAELSARGTLLSVAGGGDTVAALTHAGARNGFSYVSTAGGAFLEWLEGKELPGVKALMKG